MQVDVRSLMHASLEEVEQEELIWKGGENKLMREESESA
jgi:hypothetical protein